MSTLYFDWFDESREWSYAQAGGPAGSATVYLGHVELDFDRCAPGVLTRALIPLHPGPNGEVLLRTLLGETWVHLATSPQDFEATFAADILSALSRIAVLDEDRDQTDEHSDARLMIELEEAASLGFLRSVMPELDESGADQAGERAWLLVRADKWLASNGRHHAADVVAELRDALASGRLPRDPDDESSDRAVVHQVPELGPRASKAVIRFDPATLSGELGSNVHIEYVPAKILLRGSLESLPTTPIWVEVSYPREDVLGARLLTLNHDDHDRWSADADIDMPVPDVVIRTTRRETYLDVEPVENNESSSFNARDRARRAGDRAFRVERSTSAAAWLAADEWIKCAEAWMAAGSPRRAAGAYARAASVHFGTGSDSRDRRRCLNLAEAYAASPSDLVVLPGDPSFRTWLSLLPRHISANTSEGEEHTARLVSPPPPRKRKLKGSSFPARIGQQPMSAPAVRQEARNMFALPRNRHRDDDRAVS